MFILKEFVKGILLRGVTDDVDNDLFLEGALFHNSIDKKLKTFIDSSIREIITSSQSQTLTNKTIDYNLNTILNLPGGGGGGGGANTGLDNLTATSVNRDLVSAATITSGTNLNYWTIGTRNNSSLGTIIATGAILAGNTGNTGGFQAFSGQNFGTGNTGDINLYSGYTFTDGITGNVNIFSGQNRGSALPPVLGPSGGVNIYSGKSKEGTSGLLFINTGPIDNVIQGYDNQTNVSATGAIQINSGRIRNTVSPSRTGELYLATGTSDTLAGSGQAALKSGDVVTGSTQGSSGPVYINSGQVAASSSGNSGDINIATGSVFGAGFRGNINIQGKEIYIYDTVNNQPRIIANQYGVDTRNSLKVRPETPYSATQNFMMADMQSEQYPNLWIGVNNPANAYAACGQFHILDASGGGMSFTGSRVKATIDGTYTAGEVYLETMSLDVGSSTAANLQVNSGNLFVKSGPAWIKGTGTSANSGNVTINTGAAAGTGISGNIYLTTGSAGSFVNRGSLYIDAKNIYADGGNSVIPTTLNGIVPAGISDIDLLARTGTVFHVPLTSSTSITFSNGIPGKRFTVVANNTTGGALSITFPASVRQKAGMMVTTVNANRANIYEFVNSSNQFYLISCITDIV